MPKVVPEGFVEGRVAMRTGGVVSLLTLLDTGALQDSFVSSTAVAKIQVESVPSRRTICSGMNNVLCSTSLGRSKVIIELFNEFSMQ
jgi:hypothetical protein